MNLDELKQIEQIVGYSPAQVKRLIRQHRDTGHIRWQLARGNGFQRRDSSADIRRLAQLDKLHGSPSGAVVKNIRIDTVHQGGLDKEKGVYHINAVDEVTQLEVIMSVVAISERFLLPVLKQMLTLFPFTINNFHSDNGSKYVNHQVAKLLNKLHIELTKSRACHSNDNALAEG